MSVRPPEDACRATLRDIARGAAAAGVIGLFLNLMHLALPLYTIQVYDRVLSSGSLETLGALATLVAVVLVFQAAIDFLRSRIFVILGGVGRLYGPVIGAVLFIVLEHELGGLSEYWHIYLGALLLGVVLFARGGLIGVLAGREVAHD